MTNNPNKTRLVTGGLVNPIGSVILANDDEIIDQLYLQGKRYLPVIVGYNNRTTKYLAANRPVSFAAIFSPTESNSVGGHAFKGGLTAQNTTPSGNMRGAPSSAVETCHPHSMVASTKKLGGHHA